jgi:uncharacterized protein
VKVVIPGGTGQVGTALGRVLRSDGHQVVVLTRQPAEEGQVSWDGERLGPWAREVDGCDVVINLAGRSVSCRYTKENLTAMMRSRVRSARVVGQAIAAAARPPRAWLQMSTATIYAHTHGTANDDVTGVIGGFEEDVPGYWAFSVDIAQAWERELDEAKVPATRKVALRAAMVMTPDRGGVFDVLSRMARLGLGGPVAGGGQYVSWIHEDDFTAAVRFIIDQDILAGPVNLASPGPCGSVISCGSAGRLGRPRRASGHPVDGGARRTCHPHRHRAPAQEPASRPRPADRSGIRVPARHLAGGRP